MEIITNTTSLTQAIIMLEAKKKSEKSRLLAHFDFTKEQLNPINMVKQKFNETIHSNQTKDKIITAAMGIASGFATKALLFGKVSNPLVGVVISAIQAKLIGTIKDSNVIEEKGIPLALDFLNKIKIK